MMGKPLKVAAVVGPAVVRSRRVQRSNSAPFIIPLNMPQGGPTGARQLIIQHKAGKPSIILLKIMAMETHPGNIERLDRRRQFYKRFVSEAKARAGVGR